MTSPSFRRDAAVRAALIAGISFFVSAEALAQRVVSANSSNNSIYDVTFVGNSGFVEEINLDASTRTSVVSLVFLTNFPLGSDMPSVDLIIADQPRDELVWYQNASVESPANGTVIWSPTMVSPGPLRPDGLSLDPEQNLFVLSSTPGNNLGSSVWVLPRFEDPDADDVNDPLFFDPVLLDGNLGMYGELKETAVARTAVGPLEIGDLLVVTNDESSVLHYSKDEIDAAIGGGPLAVPSVLLGPEAFPDGEPAGIAFWPEDNSLLVTTSTGSILWFVYNGSEYTPAAQPFAADLGNGQFKIKTGFRDNLARAFVANRNGGEIFEFAAPLSGGLIATVTTGVESPNGLAVTNAATTEALTCLTLGGVPDPNGGCGALGDAVVHQLVRTTNTIADGLLLQTPCVVPQDPRVNGGVCNGQPLALSSVCPEFAAPPGFTDVMIPGEMCGDPSLAVIATIAPGIEQTDGYLYTKAEETLLLPIPPGPCPISSIGWAAIAWLGEAPSVVVDDEFEELTGGCGTSRNFGRTSSFFLLSELDMLDNDLSDGSPWNVAQLRPYVLEKYDHAQTVLAVPGAISDRRVQRDLSRCLRDSQRDFERGRRIAEAADKLIECQAILENNAGAFQSVAANPNTFGEMWGRLANLYLTISARVLNRAPNATWPPTP